MKNTIIDLNNTKNNIAPSTGYVRLKTGEDNNLQVIYDSGEVRTITSAWEMPVESFNVIDPSTITPNPWDKYIIPVGAIGAWLGHEQDIATWNSIDSIWEFITPGQGWGTYNKAENVFYSFDGTAWHTLSALPKIEDILYRDLWEKIKNNSLVPGIYYRITDYRACNNTIIGSSELDLYESPSFMLLTKAVSNNKLDSRVVDLDNIYDEVYYNPTPIRKGYFFRMQQTNGTVSDEEWMFNDGNNIVSPDNTPYTEFNMISDTAVGLGTDTYIYPTSIITVYDKAHPNGSGVYPSLTTNILDSDVSWDTTTHILTLSGDYTFFMNNSNNMYFVMVSQLDMAAADWKYGNIYWRRDVVNNVQVNNIDWRHAHYRLYASTLQYDVSGHNAGTTGYWSVVHNNFRVQSPGLNYYNTMVIDHNNYINAPMFYNTSILKNINIINCSNLVFDASVTSLHDINIKESYNLYFNTSRLVYSDMNNCRASSMFGSIEGGETYQNNITIKDSILAGTVVDVQHTIIELAFIHNIGYTDGPLRLAGLHNDANTIIHRTTGEITTSRMQSNSGNQTIIQDCYIRSIDRCYINVGSIMNGCHFDPAIETSNFNSTLTNLKLTKKSTTSWQHITFDWNIDDVEYYGECDNNVTFFQADNSTLMGDLRTSITENISYNTISINSAYTLPSLTIKVNVDSSASSYSIELPPNPFENQQYEFIDIMGNAGINNINITISSAPDVGVINTLNGSSVKTIDTNYGILIIKYSSIGGWIIVQESIIQVDITVDYATVNYKEALATVTHVGSEHDVYVDAWYRGPTFTNQTGMGMSRIPIDGVCYADKWMYQMLYCYTDPATPSPAVDNTPILPIAIYRLYATIDLTLYGLKVTENPSYSGARTIYATSRHENGRWLHEFNISLTNFRFSRLTIESTPGTSFFYQLIMVDGYPSTGKDLTVQGIDKIINADGWSVDDFITKGKSPNHEIATRKYIDNTKNNPDDITIDGYIDTNIPYSDQNDMQLLIEDAYGHGIATSSWSWVTGSPSLSNGNISLNLADDGSGFCESYNGIVIRGNSNLPADNTESWNSYVHSNLNPANGTVDIYSTNYSIPNEEVIPLIDGTYLYRSLVPKGRYRRVNGLRVRVLASSVPIADQPWFRFVKIDEYPPKQIISIKNIDYIIDDDEESIDGSNTPMLDAHRELITRAYFQAKSGSVMDMSYDELRTAITNSSLVTGKLYRITDFESINEKTPDDRTILHTTGSYPIIVQAADINNISSAVIDQQYPLDEVNYDPDNLEEIYHSLDKIDIAPYTYEIKDDRNNIIPTNLPDIDNNLNSSTEWSLGTGVIVDVANVVIETRGTNGNITAADSLTWDSVAGVLTVGNSRAFDECRSMMGHTYCGSNIISGVKRIDPSKPKGKIIHRKDVNLNIVGDFDWRNAIYIRYMGDISNIPYHFFSDDVFLASGVNTVSVGFDKDRVMHQLTPSGTGVDYNCITLTSSNNIRNVTLKNSKFVVVDWYDVDGLYLENTNNFSLVRVAGYIDNFIKNITIHMGEDIFILAGMRNVTMDEAYRCLFLSTGADGYFKNINDNTMFDFAKVDFECIYSSNAVGWLMQLVNMSGQSFNGNIIQNDFTNVNLNAGYMSNNDFDKSLSDSNIDVKDNFLSNHFQGAFQKNVISCRDFKELDINGDFERNKISASWEYMNLQTITDSKFDDENANTLATTLTESKDIINSSISLTVADHKKILNNFTMVYVLDSSGGSFELELPEIPKQNMRLILVDEAGICQTNNVSINKSSTAVAPIINTVNGNSIDPVYTIATDYAFVEFIYTDDGGWIVMKESQTTIAPDDITIEELAGHIITIKEINYIIDDDEESIDGSDTPMINAHREIITRAYSDKNTLGKKPLRLIERTGDITLNGNQTLDGVSTVNGDRVGVFAQTTLSEDGFYIVNDSGAWTRTNDLPNGYGSAGVTFEVLEGSSNQNTMWVIKNPQGTDVVNTDDLLLTQTYSMANIQWQFTGTDRLTPVNPSVEGVEIESNHNGYTWLTLRNTDNVGNGAGAVLELHKSSTAYQDNVYFGIYGDGYWLPFLAGNGALITDQNLVIGSVDNTKELRFVIGDAYTNPIQVGKIDANGLSLKSLKVSTVNPASFLNVLVDTNTGLLYANSTGALSLQTDDFVLTSTDITNGYVHLSQTININEHNLVILDSAFMHEGLDYDIDTVNNRVNFTGMSSQISVGANIQVKYKPSRFFNREINSERENIIQG